MSSLARKQSEELEYRGVALSFTEDSLCLQLSDGREIRVPLEFYPKLKKASKSQRENFEIIGLGTGIHWPELDEDLSVRGIVLVYPSIDSH